jgi:hypothetical protein
MQKDWCVAAKRPTVPAAWYCTLAFLIALCPLPMQGSARQPARNECEEAFIDRMRDDIEMIQAFPPQLRWFVQDDDDAAFLLAAATDVFQQPKEAHEHQREFVKACLLRGGGTPLYRL